MVFDKRHAKLRNNHFMETWERLVGMWCISFLYKYNAGVIICRPRLINDR